MIDAQLVNLDDRPRFPTPVVAGSIGKFEAVPGLTDVIGARCPSCEADLARFVLRQRLVRAEFDGVDEDDPGGFEVRAAPVAYRCDLSRGTVNRTRLHPSGLPWYGRGPNPTSTPPKSRLPFVYRCRCGEDVVIRQLMTPAQSWATTTEKQSERLGDALIEEAGDRYIQEKIDLDRGK